MFGLSKKPEPLPPSRIDTATSLLCAEKYDEFEALIADVCLDSEKNEVFLLLMNVAVSRHSDGKHNPVLLLSAAKWIQSHDLRKINQKADAKFTEKMKTQLENFEKRLISSLEDINKISPAHLEFIKKALQIYEISGLNWDLLPNVSHTFGPLMVKLVPSLSVKVERVTIFNSLSFSAALAELDTLLPQLGGENPALLSLDKN